jgi:hypothetical protein
MDTGNFPRVDQVEMEIEPTLQILPEMEQYENFEQSPEEIAKTEMILREDRKNELRKLAFNQGLKRETFYLINKQFDK